MRWRKSQGFDLPDDQHEVVGAVDLRGDQLPLVTSPTPRLSSPTLASSSSPASSVSTPLTTISSSTLEDAPETSTSSTPRRDNAVGMTSLHGVPETSVSTPKRNTPSSADREGQSTPGKSRVEAPTSPSLQLKTETGPTRHVYAIPVEGLSVQTATMHLPPGAQSVGGGVHHAGPGAQSPSSSPQKLPVSPQKLPVSPQKIYVPVTPQKAPVSPQKLPVSLQKLPINLQKSPTGSQNLSMSEHPTPVIHQRVTANSPQRTGVSSQRTSSPPATVWRPPSSVGNSPATRPSSATIPFTPAQSEEISGGVIVVVNGGPVTEPQSRSSDIGHVRSPSQPRATTTIPIGDVPSVSDRDGTTPDRDPPSSQQLARKRASSATRKPSSKNAVNGEAKKGSHEKSKSVTIVVNDQQVTYSNTPHTYTTTALHSNGLTNGDVPHPTAAVNGDTVMVNGHVVSKDEGDTTRPSSAASVSGGTKVDPDIQVRPLVGWWGEGGSAGSVLEDAASSDECHRSTLTLVHSPARTYLSGEAGDVVGGEDSGEAWSGVVSGVCGVALIIGAASLLRLPRLLYEYGAGSFLTAWCAVLVIIAAPLAYLEASLSQFSSSAALAVWRLVPIARGVGWSSVVVCFYWAVVVLGYVAPVIHYILLWINPILVKGGVPLECNNSLHNDSKTGDWIVDYHRLCVYELPDDWESGLELSFTWPLPAGMAATALTACIVAACGARILAGIIGATSLLTVIGLSLQLGIGLTEIYGRDFITLWELARPFLTPQGDTLMQPRVWCAAVAHVLLSLGLGVGLLMNFSSRGSFRFTLRRHLWGLMMLLIVVTAFVAVVTVIQLTLLASDRGLQVGQALASLRQDYNGTASGKDLMETIGREAVGESIGTVMITASHLIAVGTFPFTWLKQVVSSLIFLGLWCSGVTTGTVCIHALIAALRDARDCFPRVAAALLLAPLLLAAATPTVTKGGAAVVALLDGDVLSPVVLWPPFTLTLAVTTIYGIHKVRKDFTFMLEAAVCWLWAPVWGVFIPMCLLGVIVWLCVMDGQAIVIIDGPAWRTALVWGLRAVVLLPVPITAIYVVKSQLAYGVIDKVASSLQSSREWGDWGPQDPIEHHNWRRWREDETRPITSLKRRFANRPLTYTHSTLSSESSSTLTRLRNKYQRNGTASIL